MGDTGAAAVLWVHLCGHASDCWHLWLRGHILLLRRQWPEERDAGEHCYRFVVRKFPFQLVPASGT